MAKENTATRWLETGYIAFAHEGPAGIQIEKIARLMTLNKSGFYHYFGTLEIFYELLVQHHYNKVDAAMKDVQAAKSVDHDYLHVLVEHKITFLVQMQLIRHKSNALFSEAHLKVNQKVDQLIIRIWNERLNSFDNDNLALLFVGFVRDAFYARLSFENFNYYFLQDLITEVKAVLEELQHRKTSLKKFEMVKPF